MVVMAIAAQLLPGAVASAALSCASEGPGEPLILCETNTISADHSGSVHVQVPSVSMLVPRQYPPEGHSPQKSPFVGVVFKEDGPAGRWALAGNIHRSMDGFWPDQVAGTFEEVDGYYPLVPAGEYTLYFLVEEGVKDRFDFYLVDLDGSRSLSADGPAEATFESLTTHLDAPVSQSNVFSTGTAMRWDRPKLIFFNAGAAGLWADAEVQSCLHDPAPEPERAYLTCSADNTESFLLNYGTGPGSGVRIAGAWSEHIDLGSDDPEPPGGGSNGIGVSWAVAGRITASGAVRVELAFSN